jgi:hypothetical protein
MKKLSDEERESLRGPFGLPFGLSDRQLMISAFRALESVYETAELEGRVIPGGPYKPRIAGLLDSAQEYSDDFRAN